MRSNQPYTAVQAIRYSTHSQSYDGLFIRGAPDRLIIVLPDWRGCLTDYALRRGQDLASVTGADVCITDAYGVDGKPASYEGDAETWIAQSLSDPVALRKRLADQFMCLKSHLGAAPKHWSVVGYCLGGALAFEVGREMMSLDAVVSVHGIPSTLAPVTSCPGQTAFLAIHGADDSIIGLDQLRAFEAEMSAVGADWQSHTIGGARHGFTNEQADLQGSHQRYQMQAATRALNLTETFLRMEGRNI